MAKLFYASVNQAFQTSDVLSRLTSARSFLEKKVNFRKKNTGTTLYQRSIEHGVICDCVLKAFQCIKKKLLMTDTERRAKTDHNSSP